jgi:hypothetical protein
VREVGGVEHAEMMRLSSSRAEKEDEYEEETSSQSESCRE